MLGFSLTSSLRREQQKVSNIEQELQFSRRRAKEAENLLLKERAAARKAQECRQEERLKLYAAAGVAVLGSLVLGRVGISRVRSTLKSQLKTLKESSNNQQLSAMKQIKLLKNHNKELEKYGHQKFAKVMLGTADDLDRALNHISVDKKQKKSEINALHDGIEMVADAFHK